MQALAADKAGLYSDVLKLQQLTLTETLDKQVGPHDCLVQVAFSDVNPVDLHKLGSAKHFPFVPGFGGSGTVQSVGSAADKTLVGKRVCFLLDPSRPFGSYASHVVVDYRHVAELPTLRLDFRDAATIPVAGLTAYECLAKLGLAAADQVPTKQGQLEQVGLASDGSSNNPQHPKSSSTIKKAEKSLLVAGASGGVGSWVLTLAKTWHPSMTLIATASSSSSQEWCQSLGATQVLRHDQTMNQIVESSVDYIICLTEPTTTVFQSLIHVARPYGKICLVVAGKPIESLDLSLVFFKCVDVLTETVFSSIRSNYEHIVPAHELKVLVQLLSQQKIKAPLSPDLAQISEKMADALKANGVLQLLSNKQNRKRGKLVLMIHAGHEVILMDFKTASLFSIPRKECLSKNILTPSIPKTTSNATSKKGDINTSWQEQAHLQERQQLIQKICKHAKLGIAKVAEKQAQDYQDGLDMAEKESVQQLWGVQLKHRQRNKEGEEVVFVDLHTGALGELVRAKCIQAGALTVTHNSEGQEILEQAVTDFAERDDLVVLVRQTLKINLE